jgi:hypothetical protein
MIKLKKKSIIKKNLKQKITIKKNISNLNKNKMTKHLFFSQISVNPKEKKKKKKNIKKSYHMPQPLHVSQHRRYYM